MVITTYSGDHQPLTGSGAAYGGALSSTTVVPLWQTVVIAVMVILATLAMTRGSAKLVRQQQHVLDELRRQLVASAKLAIRQQHALDQLERKFVDTTALARAERHDADRWFEAGLEELRNKIWLVEEFRKEDLLALTRGQTTQTEGTAAAGNRTPPPQTKPALTEVDIGSVLDRKLEMPRTASAYHTPTLMPRYSGLPPSTPAGRDAALTPNGVADHIGEVLSTLKSKAVVAPAYHSGGAFKAYHHVGVQCVDVNVGQDNVLALPDPRTLFPPMFTKTGQLVEPNMWADKGYRGSVFLFPIKCSDPGDPIAQWYVVSGRIRGGVGGSNGRYQYHEDDNLVKGIFFANLKGKARDHLVVQLQHQLGCADCKGKDCHRCTIEGDDDGRRVGLTILPTAYEERNPNWRQDPFGPRSPGGELPTVTIGLQVTEVRLAGMDDESTFGQAIDGMRRDLGPKYLDWLKAHAAISPLVR